VRSVLIMDQNPLSYPFLFIPSINLTSYVCPHWKETLVRSAVFSLVLYGLKRGRPYELDEEKVNDTDRTNGLVHTITHMKFTINYLTLLCQV
jgi:hypothetical protein